MFRVYSPMFLVLLICVLMSLEAEGKSTIDGETKTCDSSLPTSQQVMNLIRKGLEKFIASTQQQPNPSPVETSKQSLVPALVSNCIPLMIQQNVNGSNFFNRTWAEFKVGFNDSRGNYWLGNDLLHQLTKEARYKLQCLVEARSNGVVYVAKYGTFLVGSETYNYTLRVGDYSGNAGDAMAFHNGMMFSTYDRDNDLYHGNCALGPGAGGFWYYSCYHAGINLMKSPGGDFSWYGLPSSIGRQLNSASMWLTC